MVGQWHLCCCSIVWLVSLSWQLHHSSVSPYHMAFLPVWHLSLSFSSFSFYQLFSFPDSQALHSFSTPWEIKHCLIPSIKMGGNASVYTNDWHKTFTSLSQKCIYGRSIRKSNWKIKIYLKKDVSQETLQISGLTNKWLYM